MGLFFFVCEFSLILYYLYQNAACRRQVSCMIGMRLAIASCYRPSLVTTTTHHSSSIVQVALPFLALSWYRGPRGIVASPKFYDDFL